MCNSIAIEAADIKRNDGADKNEHGWESGV
jgi:hypothetical protein